MRASVEALRDRLTEEEKERCKAILRVIAEMLTPARHSLVDLHLEPPPFPYSEGELLKMLDEIPRGDYIGLVGQRRALLAAIAQFEESLLQALSGELSKLNADSQRINSEVKKLEVAQIHEWDLAERQHKQRLSELNKQISETGSNLTFDPDLGCGFGCHYLLTIPLYIVLHPFGLLLRSAARMPIQEQLDREMLSFEAESIRRGTQYRAKVDARHEELLTVQTRRELITETSQRLAEGNRLRKDSLDRILLPLPAGKAKLTLLGPLHPPHS